MVCQKKSAAKTPLCLALNMSSADKSIGKGTFLLVSLFVVKTELELIYLPHQFACQWPSIRFSSDLKFHPFCESAILHTLTLVSNSTYSHSLWVNDISILPTPG